MPDVSRSVVAETHEVVALRTRIAQLEAELQRRAEHCSLLADENARLPVALAQAQPPADEHVR